MKNSSTNFQTIAVDFDGTLCYSNWPELGQPNEALISYQIGKPTKMVSYSLILSRLDSISGR